MKLVVIESPFGTRLDGTPCTPEEIAANETYLDRCIAHSLALGEAPFASHGFYPRVLNDAIPEQRKQGMAAGFAWGAQAELCVVYTNRGITKGMREGIARAEARRIQVQYRKIYDSPL